MPSPNLFHSIAFALPGSIHWYPPVSLHLLPHCNTRDEHHHSDNIPENFLLLISISTGGYSFLYRPVLHHSFNNPLNKVIIFFHLTRNQAAHQQEIHNSNLEPLS